MRLIDADALTEVLNDSILNDPNCPIFVAATVEQAIDHAPTVDAEPVRHGEWKYRFNDFEHGRLNYFCSECQSLEYVQSNYCPFCGARMDGGINDAESNPD